MPTFDELLEEFGAGAWGHATATQADAAGLCLRASLVFLATLDAAGLPDDVCLCRLTGAIGGRDRGPDGYGTHWVLVRDGEVIDVSARQFEPTGPRVRRCPADEELSRWHHKSCVNPDSAEVWAPEGPVPVREIPPYWRDIRDVAPPGDLPAWPYPRHRLDERSSWYLPLDDSE